MTRAYLYTHTLNTLKMMRLYYLICIPIESIDHFFDNLNIRIFNTYDDYFGDDEDSCHKNQEKKKTKTFLQEAAFYTYSN